MLNPAPRMRARAALDAVAVVSFDLDDTFWDCAPAISRAEEVLYAWLQNNAPLITAVHDRESLLAFRSNFRKAHPELAGCVTAMRLGGLRSLVAEFGYEESLAEQAFDIFYKSRSEVTLYPGVVELLSGLTRRYRLAAITNGNADLSAIGIDKYFDRIYAADLELKAKPSADMFDRCCANFGIEAANMLHVGDNLVADVQGALDAGAQSLWFNQHGLDRPTITEPPHFEACSIEQIKTLLVCD